MFTEAAAEEVCLHVAGVIDLWALRIWVLGLRVQDLGFRVYGQGLIYAMTPVIPIVNLPTKSSYLTGGQQGIKQGNVNGNCCNTTGDYIGGNCRD